MDWFEAAATGDVGLVAKLLREGASIDAVGKLGRTALMFASAAGHTRVIDVCLRNGANPNLPDPGGVTALMLAAHGDRHEAVAALLAAGGDLKQRDLAGRDVAWYSTHREVDFVVPYPRGWHGTIFVRRLFPTKSARLVKRALADRR